MIRGIDSKHEQGARQLARDTRPLGARVADALSKPFLLILICGTSIAITVVVPLATDVLFLACLGLFIFVYTRPTALPFRVPRSANAKDYNDPIPGSNKPKMGEGIAFFGNDRLTREELWFSNDDLRTHVLIFGSTGSGKTEALVSIAFNSLIHASGFIYIDGKGDNSLFAKVFSMVRSMGRDDDMLLINFMTGARDVIGPQKSRLSNTMNPFSRGSSSMLSQLVVSIMSGGKQGGGDDMWTGRAINFVESLMKVLTVMRDAGHILLDANSIRDFFILEKLEQIVVDKTFPVDETTNVSLEPFPKQILEPLTAYIRNLPGYNPQKKGNQAGEVREQHGFITMQLTRAFGSLADTYGHIIRTNLAEVDLKDVVLNRRIMVVLLPALEKSPQELSNLGKIIIASLKAMMAAGLGDEVEGDYRDVVLRKPTTAPSPFVCIMDEYGYYAVEGFAVVPAQARSLGFSAIFAGQDLPAFQKASKEEAASIGANCNIKICMKLEDPQETWEFFNKVAGEAYVTNVSGFQMDAGSMTMNYMDTRSASVDKRQRIDLLDLKDQRPGESHIFFKSKIVRAEMFYASPKPVKKMRLNQGLKIEPPSEGKLIAMASRLQRFKEVFAVPHYQMPQPFESEDIKTLTQTLQGAINLKPFERGIAALITILEHEVQKQKDLSVPYEVPGVENEMSAFTKIFITPLVLRMIGAENQDLFALPLIRRGSTTEEMKHIERLCGKSEQDALKIATSVIADIENATRFPPEVQFESDVNTMLEDISNVVRMFTGEPMDIERLKEEVIARGEVHEFSEFEELPEFPELADLSDLEGFEFSEEGEEEMGEEGFGEAGLAETPYSAESTAFQEAMGFETPEGETSEEDIFAPTTEEETEETGETGETGETTSSLFEHAESPIEEAQIEESHIEEPAEPHEDIFEAPDLESVLEEDEEPHAALQEELHEEIPSETAEHLEEPQVEETEVTDLHLEEPQVEEPHLSDVSEETAATTPEEHEPEALSFEEVELEQPPESRSVEPAPEVVEEVSYATPAVPAEETTEQGTEGTGSTGGLKLVEDEDAAKKDQDET